ncbi:hypothetical protein H0H81_012239 [Sphagnurus paluster]|uniref:WD40 repeat-like protein n=1 Tax=Sphagnurus paluster TaxID=117069 RepID=A0A9P7K736_9AGAR|nr:hypothetical protein H0H81_012239 [Sphagnurus paluster]
MVINRSPMDIDMQDDQDDQQPRGQPRQQPSIHDILSYGAPQREGARAIRLNGINIHEISRLLNTVGASRQLELDEDDDPEDDDDEEDDDFYHAFRSSGEEQWTGPKITEPQQAGVELLNSGDFGRVENKLRARRNDVNIARLILNRTKRPHLPTFKEDYAADLIPNTNGTAVAIYDSNIYTAQYSADSSFYYTCSQDFRLNVFDTTAPPTSHRHQRSHSQLSNSDPQTNMKIRKSIQGNPGRWTITDANLSPNNERMVYSSITPTAYVTNILDDSQVQTPIPFADVARPSDIWGYGESFGIFSCRFSADGNEIVAGGSGKIFVYDLLANCRTVKIAAHTDDVNSCTWADTASGNILVSASDDASIKIWDRRSLGASRKPSGVLLGHTEGITYVSAKGDGRYIISNGKDQAMRLWDLRKMRSSKEYESVERKRFGVPRFDYRSTIQAFIWSLDGRVVQVLDRAKTLPMSFDPTGPEPPALKNRRGGTCVRDVSWHSQVRDIFLPLRSCINRLCAQEPVLMSAAWEYSDGGSVVARHEWKGLSKLGGSVEAWVEKKQQEEQDTSRVRRSSRFNDRRFTQRIPGAFEDEDEDD